VCCDSAALGLVIDNLVKVTIVTPDGSIQTASSTENTDLFWAIRGGGCNFGVVTEFVYKLYPQRKTVYAGYLVFPPPMLEKVISVTEKWWSKGPDEKQGIVQFLTRGPDGNARTFNSLALVEMLIPSLCLALCSRHVILQRSRSGWKGSLPSLL
jgi:FAD/FMN-containing dehydrogenase